jgi:hypothetical protein
MPAVVRLGMVAILGASMNGYRSDGSRLAEPGNKIDDR